MWLAALLAHKTLGDLASSCGGLRDGDDGPHLLELRFNKNSPRPPVSPVDERGGLTDNAGRRNRVRQ